VYDTPISVLSVIVPQQPQSSPDPHTEPASSIVPDFHTLHPSYGINLPPSVLMQPTPDYEGMCKAFVSSVNVGGPSDSTSSLLTQMYDMCASDNHPYGLNLSPSAFVAQQQSHPDYERMFRAFISNVTTGEPHDTTSSLLTQMSDMCASDDHPFP
jgi:hypothetical protein